MKQKRSRFGFYMALLLFSLLLWRPVHAAEATSPVSSPQDTIVQSQLERLDTKEIEAFWQKVLEKYGGYLPESDGRSLFEMVTGEKGFSFTEVMKGLGAFLFHELLINGKLLGAILIITVFAMVLETLQTAFEKNTVSMVAYAISYMVLIILAVNSFRVAVDFAQGAIQDMVGFMLALMPLVLVLLASTGGITSAALFHPMVVFLVNTSGTLISTIVFPLLFLSAILSIVSSFSVKYQLTKLAQLLRTVSLGVMGSFLTIFLAVLSLQGATAAVADGIAIRTAKYVAGNFIPVVGRVFADAADTVVGASLLVKNTVGIAGVLILLFLVAFPSLKILMLALIYHLSSAVMQPLGNSPVLSCLGIIGKNLLYIFGALATVSLMFFLAIMIIISAANVSVMMR
ncbi:MULTISPECIES: stage III sporulation protein AE [Aneurinibacillus]|nr:MULTISPECIES: stage III sporulation protein AE [Aneurinibacillus]MED0681286.1 stage III sporulation protein AE [Aneurinibacillus thermoaerophilus]MED0735504.1 stage III sporulation protein AE [Aneurinibacillus thermoaerophilus]MED0756612.1 stage III sporulation protein AE [Aneurinibacillus thermoaerophilus]MED0760662.1 stage III sporulation protein AE [Aneurinibacillus thermoaerophilus]MED0764305.1 stage III sporulation protein AE [Aneurinibacillus thermoaerophilus]